MSLKGVELQIAIPKTFDAGKIAEQAQQQVLANQAHANEALKKEVERKQLTVNMSERAEEVDVDDEAEQQEYTNANHQRKKKKRAAKKKQDKTQHPFKGNFVDYSG